MNENRTSFGLALPPVLFEQGEVHPSDVLADGRGLGLPLLLRRVFRLELGDSLAHLHGRAGAVRLVVEALAKLGGFGDGDLGNRTGDGVGQGDEDCMR